MQYRLLTAIAALFWLAAPAQATPYLVDFEGDSVGAKPNGFVSGGITFNDTNGADLQVYDSLPVECAALGNHCLVNFFDDTGGLEMLFGQAVNFLSFDFGNDDSMYMPSDGLAYLQLFLGANLVGTASVVTNADDIMNQSISFSGTVFDRALFTYTDAATNPITLIEVVDNIAYETVPEPASVMLFGLALTGLALSKRRRV